MKKFNLFIFIYYSLILFIIFFSIFNFLILKDGYNNLSISKETYDNCKIMINDKHINSDDYEYCYELLSFETPTSSSFYFFESILTEGIMGVIFPYFVPFIVIFPLVFILSKLNSSKFVKIYTLRKTYKKFIKRIYLNAYKNIFIIPLFIVLLFVICMVITKNLNPRADIHFMLLGNDLINLYNSTFFYIIYILILILNMGIYTNIALFIISKNKNFLVTLIESYLSIYIIWCVSEILLGISFQKYFNIKATYFSLLNIYRWRNTDNIMLYFIINTFWFILTLVLSIYGFKNKEKYLIMCEK